MKIYNIRDFMSTKFEEVERINIEIKTNLSFSYLQFSEFIAIISKAILNFGKII